MQPDQPNPGYQQPYPQPQPQPQQTVNPYGFIMDDQTPQKSGGLSSLFGGGSKKSRIIVIAGGIVVLLLIGWMLLSLLGGGDKAQNEKLLGLAVQQTEIIRVSNLAEESRVIRRSSTRNLATNGELIMESQKKDIVTLLAKNKVKIKEKQLIGGQNKKIDSKLSSSANNNTYDDTFVEVYEGLLTQYQRSLKDTYNTSKSRTEKEVLLSAYDSIATMLKG